MSLPSGAAGRPATIALSPDDYQRIYRTNELEARLSELGGKLTTLVPVGVGLANDPVWEALGSAELTIIALWLDPGWFTETEEWRKRGKLDAVVFQFSADRTYAASR